MILSSSIIYPHNVLLELGFQDDTTMEILVSSSSLLVSHHHLLELLLGQLPIPVPVIP